MVDMGARKGQIKKAVEEMYSVKVVKVKLRPRSPRVEARRRS
jgi:ribosomal protein L23